MSVLVFLDHEAGVWKKSSLEKLSYAAQLSQKLQLPLHALSYGKVPELQAISNFGLGVLHLQTQELGIDAYLLAKSLEKTAEKVDATWLILGSDAWEKAAGSMLAIYLKAAIITGVSALAEVESVEKTVYSGKATAKVNLKTKTKILCLLANAVPFIQFSGSIPKIENLDLAPLTSGLQVKSVKKSTHTGIPLPEAERVVSAGRGLQGPENWGMIEELADLLKAATACSRPVSDSDWRPHHEHVGQTGLTIRPNLYIAIGISGAIQHLAGVSGSKIIVVINKDKEAPFFKAAHYGIVADAFSVVPKLIAILKEKELEKV